MAAGSGGDANGSVPPLLAHDTGFLLFRLGGESRRRLTGALAERGLAARHHAVLLLLEERSRLAQRDVAEVLGLDRSYVVALVDELEQGGFVERSRDPADRRRLSVSLTPSGRQVATAARALANQVEEDLLAPLEPEDRSLFHDLLYRLAAFHDSHIDAG
jgi:DNA-binding MarR family transcriptional regulator